MLQLLMCVCLITHTEGSWRNKHQVCVQQLHYWRAFQGFLVGCAFWKSEERGHTQFSNKKLENILFTAVASIQSKRLRLHFPGRKRKKKSDQT